MDDQNDLKISRSWRESGEKPLSLSCIEYSMLFCVLFPVLSLFLSLLGDGGAGQFLWPLFLCGGILFARLLRAWVRRFWSLLGLLAALFAGTLFLAQGVAVKILAGVCVGAACAAQLRAFYRRRLLEHDEETEPPDSHYVSLGEAVLGTLALYACFLAALATGRMPGMALCVAGGAALLILFELYRHLCGVNAALREDGAGSGIRRQSRFFAAGLAAGISAAAALCVFLYSKWLYPADRSFLAMLRQMGRQSGGAPESVPSVSTPSVSLPSRPPLDRLNTGAPAAPNPFLVFLEEKVLPVVGLVLLTVCIVWALRRLARLMRPRADQDVTRESIFRETMEQKLRRPRLPQPFLFFSARTAGARIRRAYRALVTRRIRQGADVRASDTPTEIAPKLETAQAAQLTSLYEKARYGAADCTEAEAEAFKKLLHR